MMKMLVQYVEKMGCHMIIVAMLTVQVLRWFVRAVVLVMVSLEILFVSFVRPQAPEMASLYSQFQL